MKRIKQIKIDELNNVEFYFEDSDEGFTSTEFKQNTLTRKHLDAIEYEIMDANTEAELLSDNSD